MADHSWYQGRNLMNNEEIAEQIKYWRLKFWSMIVIGFCFIFILIFSSDHAKLLICRSIIVIGFGSLIVSGLKNGQVTFWWRGMMMQKTTRQGSLRMQFNYWAIMAFYFIMDIVILA